MTTGNLPRRRSHIQRGEDRRGQHLVPGHPLIVGELVELLPQHVLARHVARELAQPLGEFGHRRIHAHGPEIVAVDHRLVLQRRRRIPNTDKDWPRLLDRRHPRRRIIRVVRARRIQLIQRTEAHTVLARLQFAPKLGLSPSPGGAAYRHHHCAPSNGRHSYIPMYYPAAMRLSDSTEPFYPCLSVFIRSSRSEERRVGKECRSRW